MTILGHIGTDREADLVDPAALDALHILPLAIIPLKTPAIQKAQMIKNARLESVIELFRDGSAGSGQINPSDLWSSYQDTPELREDISVLETVATLEAFDVFSLRAELRRLDIGFSDFDALKLSDDKRQELTSYMRDFTRPLIARIYGSQETEINDVSDIVKMLAQPDKPAAMKQLQRLAKELQIQISEVPNFIEHYGDIFLSLSFYRKSLDDVTRVIPAYISWMNEIRESYEVRDDRLKQKLFDEIETQLSSISTSISARFQMFESRSKVFWDDINAGSFQEFRDMITAHHVTVAAVLCGLAVKMMRWREAFPSRRGPPAKRLEFIHTEIYPGLARIREIEQNVVK